MLWPGVDQLRLMRVARAGSDLAARLARALTRGAWRDDARTLKATDAGAVFDATLDQTPVIIKTHPLESYEDRFASAFGRSRLARQWRGAELLESIGVRTARPYALCRGITEDDRLTETLILERLEGHTLLEHLRDRDLTDEDVRALTESMAHDLETMWLRAFNRDHKPSNLVVVREEGALRAAVVDTVGVRRLRGIGTGSDAKLARMLASLWIEPSGVRCTPATREAYRLVCRITDAPTPKGNKKPGWSRARSYRAARRLWSMASEIVRHHPDPTPKDDPFPTRP